MKFIQAIAVFIDELKHISISQWDVEQEQNICDSHSKSKTN